MSIRKLTGKSSSHNSVIEFGSNLYFVEVSNKRDAFAARDLVVCGVASQRFNSDDCRRLAID